MKPMEKFRSWYKNHADEVNGLVESLANAMDSAPGNGWSCDCTVGDKDTEFTLYKDGQLVCRTYAHIYDRTDLGIAQSISYAAHMAYKQVEQMSFVAKRISGGKKNG